MKWALPGTFEKLINPYKYLDVLNVRESVEHVATGEAGACVVEVVQHLGSQRTVLRSEMNKVPYLLPTLSERGNDFFFFFFFCG